MDALWASNFGQIPAEIRSSRRLESTPESTLAGWPGAGLALPGPGPLPPWNAVAKGVTGLTASFRRLC